jgi:uncharacterized protein YjaZ
MKFNILDTESTYRRMLEVSGDTIRKEIFRDELIAPFTGLVNIFGGDGIAAFAQWGMSPEQFGAGNRAAMTATLDKLAAYDAWSKAAQALDDARAAFAAHDDRIPLDTIVFGLLVADLRGNPLDRGYTGFGGLPGYIMTVYGEPNAYNLARIKGATAHELHHNVRFAVEPFHPMAATVGQYIIAEGLAESFAAELYGEDVLGYYVTDFDDAQIATARHVIGGALDVTGFDKIRGYIFGDTIAQHMGLPKAGVPDYAGYVIGYRVVQQYLKHTRTTVAAATFVPWDVIIAESGFFA